MEIQYVRISVTDEDIRRAIEKYVRKNSTLRSLKGGIRPEGIMITGKYRTIIPVKVLLKPSVSGGKLYIDFLRIEAVKLNLKNLVFAWLREKLTCYPGLSVSEERVVFDIETLLAETVIPVGVNLQSVTTDDGMLIIECNRRVHPE